MNLSYVPISSAGNGTTNCNLGLEKIISIKVLSASENAGASPIRSKTAHPDDVAIVVDASWPSYSQIADGVLIRGHCFNSCQERQEEDRPETGDDGDDLGYRHIVVVFYASPNSAF